MIKAQIAKVAEDSIAKELGIEAGDFLLKINGKVTKDIIEYENSIYVEALTMEILKKNNNIWELIIEKDEFDDLGIEFKEPIFDGIRTCKNNCLFCFVSQLPKGMRKSLYIKDEDYRLSYLYGSYTTLSNLEEEDYQRIINENISPLYISVHAINQEIREKLFRSNYSKEILSKLEFFKDNNINMITQAVIIPGLNDGEILEETIDKLYSFYPSVESLTIVPVGLTNFHKDGLRLHTKEEAKNTVKTVMKQSENMKKKIGTRFVFIADEFFLKAGLDIPESDYYEDFEHLENGVGLVRAFLDEVKELELPNSLDEKIDIVTGTSFYKILKQTIGYIKGISIIPIENNYFGKQITVTGLLTGKDIINQIEGKLTSKILILNRVMLNNDGKFLDDITVSDIKEKLDVEIRLIEKISEIF